MKEQIINLDIYRRGVVILQGESIEDIKSWLSKHDCNEIADCVSRTDWDNTLAITVSDERDVYVIAKEQMNASTLAHELSHAALKIMKIIGIDPLEAEEAYAYLFEYLIGKAIV